MRIFKLVAFLPYIALFTVLLVQPFASASKQVLIKLSPTDCVNCVASLDIIATLDPAAAIVMEKRFEKDASTIIDHLGLGKFSERITWSDSLAALFPSDYRTHIQLFQDGRLIWSELLQNLDVREFRNVLLHACDYSFPSMIDINATPVGFVMKNRLNKSYSILTAGKETAISVPDAVMKSVYVDLLQDTMNYQLFLEKRNKVDFRPQIRQVVYDEERQSYLCMISSYRLEKVLNAEDSVYGFVISLMELKGDSVIGVHLIDLLSADSPYILSLNGIFKHKGALYTRVNYALEDEPEQLKFLAGLRRDEGRQAFAIHKLYDYFLPQYLLDQKIIYSGLHLLKSHQYLTFPLSDKIYNLENDEIIEMPFPPGYYLKNEQAMRDHKIKFIVFDMKYNPSDRQFTVLYLLEDVLYAGRFKAGAPLRVDKAITENVKDIRAYCLSQDGRKVVLISADRDCLDFVTVE
jgi:hypothetical protein